MPMAGGIALLSVGAIFTFALTRSVQGIDLRVVGVILMLAGALALLLPRLVRTSRGGRRRSDRPTGQHARSRQDAIDDGDMVELPNYHPARHDAHLVRDRRRPWVRRSRG